MNRSIIAMLLAASSLLAGCQPGGWRWPELGGPKPAGAAADDAEPAAAPDKDAKPLTRFGKYEVRDRAENLLVAGTRSEFGLIVCNSIEGLERVAPATAKTRVQALLESESPLVRYAALITIGRLRDRTALSRVQKLRSDASNRVRLAAIFASAKLGDSSAAPQLAKTLEKDPDENMRADAAFLLGKLGEKRAVRRLEAAQRMRLNAKSNRVLLHILGARADLGDTRAVEELAAFTRGDAVSRVLALQVLADSAAPQSRAALTYAFKDKAEYLENRLIAVRGLGRLGSREGYALARQSLAHTGTNNEDPNETARIRSLAALALGAMRSEDAIGALRDLCEKSDDERIQVAAAVAICEIVGE